MFGRPDAVHKGLVYPAEPQGAVTCNTSQCLRQQYEDYENGERRQKQQKHEDGPEAQEICKEPAYNGTYGDAEVPNYQEDRVIRT